MNQLSLTQRTLKPSALLAGGRRFESVIAHVKIKGLRNYKLQPFFVCVFLYIFNSKNSTIENDDGLQGCRACSGLLIYKRRGY